MVYAPGTGASGWSLFIRGTPCVHVLAGLGIGVIVVISRLPRRSLNELVLLALAAVGTADRAAPSALLAPLLVTGRVPPLRLPLTFLLEKGALVSISHMHDDMCYLEQKEFGDEHEEKLLYLVASRWHSVDRMISLLESCKAGRRRSPVQIVP